MRRFIEHTLPIVALGLALGAGASSHAGTPPVPAKTQQESMRSGPKLDLLSDAEILVRLHEANQRAIFLGDLAARKAESREVEQLGKAVDEHARISRGQVLEVGSQLKIALVVGDGAAKSLESTMNNLKRLSGVAFDEAWVSAIRADRDAIITVLTRQVSPSAAKELTALIVRLLPELRHEREQAEELVRAFTAQRKS